MEPQLTLAQALLKYSATEKPTQFEFVDATGGRQTAPASSMLQEAERWASAFWQSGVRPGDRVILSVDSNDAFVYAFWGSQLCGAIPATMPPFETQNRIEQQCDHIRNVAAIIKPRIAIVESRFIEPHELSLGFPVANTQFVSASKVSNLPAINVDAGSIGLIQFTSGSTRAPKGCALSHRAILANAKAILERGAGQPNDVNVHWVPLSHDMGLMGAVIVPIVGRHSSIIMHPKRFMMRPLAWLEELAAHRNVHTSVPNFALRMVTRRADRFGMSSDSLSYVKNIICGAEAINAADVRAFFDAFAQFGLNRQSFHASYGMAEATVMATSKPGGLKTLAEPSIDRGLQNSTADQREYVSVGRAVKGAEIRVVNDLHQAVAEGEAGEIEVKSGSIMTGYFNDAAATAEKIADGWLKTGDIGFIHGHDLYIKGRKSEILIIAGKNIYPSDIEPAIADELNIDPRKVAVFSKQGQFGTEELVVIVEKTRDELEMVATDRISRACQIACGIVPSRILFRKSGTIPKTTSGKIVRTRLRSLYRDENI